MQEIGNFRINDHPLRRFLECQTIEKFLCRLIIACFCAWYHNTSLNTSLIREFRSMWERNLSGEQKRTLMSQTYIMVAKCVMLCRKLVNILSLWNNKPRYKISFVSLGFIKLEQKMVNLTRVFHYKVRFQNIQHIKCSASFTKRSSFKSLNKH